MTKLLNQNIKYILDNLDSIEFYMLKQRLFLLTNENHHLDLENFISELYYSKIINENDLKNIISRIKILNLYLNEENEIQIILKTLLKNNIDNKLLIQMNNIEKIINYNIENNIITFEIFYMIIFEIKLNIKYNLLNSKEKENYKFIKNKLNLLI